MKRIGTLLLCLIFIVSLAVSADAAMEFTYIDIIYSNLEFNTFWGIANCVATVESVNDVRLDIMAMLQVNKDGQWETVQSWSNTGTEYVSIDNSYAVSRGYQYRLYVIAYAYNPDGTLAESGSAIDYAYLN